MTFALTSNPSQSEISEAINYLLANFGANLSVDPNNGQITGSSGIIIAYFYKYLSVKYANSFDGTVNFNNSPTNQGYYGLRNTDSSVESSNPADYIWYQATGGFGTTKFLFYETSGGRQINFVVATTTPGTAYVQESGPAIDLDVVTNSTATAAAAAALATANNKLSKIGADNLQGPISLNTSDSILVGTTTDGVSIGNTGIIGRKAGVTTFSVANTGDAIFAGALSAATGTFSGSLSAATGTFAGALSAATGSFAGSLSAATGTFSGSLSAATGTFSGSLSAATGTFAGSLSAATGTFAGSLTAASGTFNGDLITTGKLSLTGSGNVIAGYSVSQYINSSASYACIYANNTANASVATFYTGNARTIYAQNNSSFSANSSIVGDNIGNGAGIQATANTGTALTAFASSGNAFSCQGAMTITSNALVTNLNADRLDNYHASDFLLVGGNAVSATFATSAGSASTASLASDSNSLGGVTASSWARIFPTNSGTANAGGSGVNLLGSTSTGIAGAYVGTSGSSNIVTWTVQTTSPSDVRLKEEIANADLGLDFVKQLRPVSYKLKADPKHQKGYGFIAQEVESLIGGESSLVYHEPDWKVGNETGFKTIHYPSYIAVLTKAIQELTAKVEALETQLKG